MRDGELKLLGVYTDCGKTGLWTEHYGGLTGVGQFVPREGIRGYQIVQYVHDTVLNHHLEVITAMRNGAVHDGPWIFSNDEREEVGRIVFELGEIISKEGKVPDDVQYMISEDDFWKE